jgi:hypothetical protein
MTQVIVLLILAVGALAALLALLINRESILWFGRAEVRPPSLAPSDAATTTQPRRAARRRTRPGRGSPHPPHLARPSMRLTSRVLHPRRCLEPNPADGDRRV